MNMVRAKGNLKHEFKEKIKSIWHELTEDEIALYDNERHLFFKAVYRKYGLEKPLAEGALKALEEQIYEIAA